METQEIFSDLKLRASYGVTGNTEDIGPFNAKLVYGITGTYYNKGVQDNAYGPLQGANPDLRWKRTSTSNPGLDFTILSGKLSGSLDVYKKITKDMLFQYAVSPALVPGMLTTTPVRTRDFTWSSSFIVAHNVNQIASL